MPVKRTITILSILFLIVQASPAQKQLPESVEKQIENYKVNAIKNRNVGNDNAAASYLNKIAYLYWEYFIYDKAIQTFDEVRTINEAAGNDMGTMKVNENMAFIYSDMERYDLAAEYFLKTLDFLQKKGDKAQLAAGYNNIASAFNNNEQPDKAIDYAKLGLGLSQELNDERLIRSFYGILHESFDKQGDSQKAMEYFQLYSTIDKHINSKAYAEREKISKEQLSKAESEKAMALHDLEETKDTLEEVEEVSKDQKMAIALLNKEAEIDDLMIANQNAEIQAKKRSFMFLVVFLVVVALFAVYAYQQMRAKKKSNKKLKELNEEISRKNRQILDSINYASHIQEAILPFEKSLKKDLPNSFIFYQPRDIVSGDFYWYTRHEDKIFVAAVDCTGHGVPGAFMSMIGNTLLNEVVNENNIYDPAEVLKVLNEKTEFTLNQQEDSHGFSEDGMDISFICYDLKRKELELSLANHTACLIQNGEHQLLEGDMYSVGGNVGLGTVKYTKHCFKVNVDTTLYLYSDGYQDQFGGFKNRKFYASRFQKLLRTLADIEFNKQYGLLKEEFDSWKGNQPQVDDVLVIGLKFKA